ncbi:pyrroline-5-carboxylate reductase [Bordetella ansorpii]|uniref:Pyrroline-5-carboxylate reductase n=2 Tax=Bordetella ansorpii TaxID=288768 RepID=A0A157SEQ0_9BORD|nr:pyrroline-5-carboxylate reductase [Bordetella ansorpii]
MNIVIFGVGHMGSAILRGLQRNARADVLAVDPDPKRRAVAANMGVNATDTPSRLGSSDIAVLAMPPQAFAAFAASQRAIHATSPVVSVMAGIRASALEAALATPQVIRAIPNTPSEFYEGMTVFYAPPAASPDTIAAAGQIFETIGRVLHVQNEALLDPATALCGGGPAFVAYFAHALAQFATDAGFAPAQAAAMTAQVLRGTATLLERSAKPAMQLCQEVMTAGGTTERGIQVFERKMLGRIIYEALEKASARSAELGGAETADTGSPTMQGISTGGTSC